MVASTNLNLIPFSELPDGEECKICLERNGDFPPSEAASRYVVHREPTKVWYVAHAVCFFKYLVERRSQNLDGQCLHCYQRITHIDNRPIESHPLLRNGRPRYQGFLLDPFQRAVANNRIDGICDLIEGRPFVPVNVILGAIQNELEQELVRKWTLISASRCGRVDLLDALLTEAIPSEVRESALRIAAERDQIGSIQRLLINHPITAVFRGELIQAAASCRAASTVQWLLQNGEILEEHRGRSIAILAGVFIHEQRDLIKTLGMIELIVRSGDITPHAWELSLSQAVKQGRENAPVVEKILDLSGNLKPALLEIAIREAVSSNRRDLIQALLPNHPVSVPTRCAALFSAFRNGSFRMIPDLFTLGK